MVVCLLFLTFNWIGRVFLGQLVVGKVDCENGNRQYDAAVKEFQKMGIEKESKKKKKKIKDKEIRKLESEITKSLFDHSSTPSKNSSKKPQKFDRNLDIFHQLIPECVFEQPTAWNKNQSDTCMTISCAESVEDEYKPFDMVKKKYFPFIYFFRLELYL